MKVMVTGAGALLGQGIIRALRQSEPAAHITALDPSPYAPGLYWADCAHLLPLAADPSYLERLADLLAREQPDALLVGTDVELGPIARAKDLLEAVAGTKVLVSPPEVVAIADDKFLTFRFLEGAGFKPPRSCLPGGEEALLAEVGFPLIVKPRTGARSRGLALVRNRDELAARLALGDSVVIQECVAGETDEYTAGVLVFGENLASIVMRRTLRDGNTWHAFAGPFLELRPAIEAMARALRPFGPANFQFRLAGDRLAVFEINARFSGTTPLRHLAGFPEVSMALRHLLHGEPLVQPQIRPLVLLRHLAETAVVPEEILRSG